MKVIKEPKFRFTSTIKKLTEELSHIEPVNPVNQDNLDNPNNHYKIEFISRPKLKKYLGFGKLDFHAKFDHMSRLDNGDPVVCLTDVRDPMTHDILTDHVWVKLNDNTSKTLHSLRKESPVRVRAKVVKYNGEKIGLKIDYINLVKGQRNYTVPSVWVNND